MPLITSCCPAWVDYMEKYYPDMVPNFSTAKSPQQMMGAMIKTFWAQKAGIDPGEDLLRVDHALHGQEI